MDLCHSSTGSLNFRDGGRATYLSERSRFNEVVHELHTQSLTVVDHLSLWGEGENMRECERDQREREMGGGGGGGGGEGGITVQHTCSLLYWGRVEKRNNMVSASSMSLRASVKVGYLQHSMTAPLTPNNYNYTMQSY